MRGLLNTIRNHAELTIFPGVEITEHLELNLEHHSGELIRGKRLSE